MNIDLSQFDNLELDNLANWQLLAKSVFVVFIAIVVAVIGYIAIVSNKISLLDRVTEKEIELKETYKVKYHIAANLELFQQQMQESEQMFSKQLKSLPESHETPGLLDDITFVGTTSGLDFVKLNWQPEITQQNYIELPISIEVVGFYHEFGNFFSKMAGLPRIVTLHDFTINMKPNESSQLSLKLQAKTYRYREVIE